jgi:hypothetical protein
MEAVFDPITRKWTVPEGEEDPTAGRMGLTFADQQAMKGGGGSVAAAVVNADMAAAAQSAAKSEPLIPTSVGGFLGDTFKAGSNVAVGMGTGLVDLGLLGVDAARAATGDFGGLTQGLNRASPKLGSAAPMTWSDVGESRDNPLTAWRIQTLTPESTTFKAISYMGEIASWFVNPKGLGGVAVKGATAVSRIGRADDLVGVLKGEEAIGGLASAIGKLKEAFPAAKAARFGDAMETLKTSPRLANSGAAKRILGAMDNADPLMARQMERALINSATTNPLVRAGAFIKGNVAEYAAAPLTQKARIFGEVVLKDLYANFMVVGARPLEDDASGLSRWLADNTPPPFSAAARYLVPEYQDAPLVAKTKMLAEGVLVSWATQPLMDAARIGLMARRNKFSELSPEFRDQLLGILQSPARAADYVGLRARQGISGLLPEGQVRGLLEPGAVGQPGAERLLLPPAGGSYGTTLDDLRALRDSANATSAAANELNRTAMQEQTFQAARQALETLAGGPPVETMPGGPRPAWEQAPIGERGYGKNFTQGELAANEGKAPKPAWEGAEGGTPPAPGAAEPGWGGPPARPGEPAPVPQWQPLPTPHAVVSPEAIRTAAKEELDDFLAKNLTDNGINPEAVAAKVEEVGQKVMGLLPHDRTGRVDYMKTFIPKVNRAGVMDPIDTIWHDAVTKQGLEEGWVRMADDFSGFQFSRAEAQALDESDAMSKLADEVFQATEQERLLKAGAEPEVPAAEQTVDVQAAPVEQAPVNLTDQSVVAQGQANIQAAGNQLQDTVQAGADRQPQPDMPTEVMGQEPVAPAAAPAQDAVGQMQAQLQQIIDNPGAPGTAIRASNESRAKALLSELAPKEPAGASAPAVDEAAVARALQDEVFEGVAAPVPPKLTDAVEISLPKISQNEKAMLAEAFGTGEGKVAFGAYSAKGGAQSMGDVAEILEGMTKADGWTQAEIRTGASLSKKIRRALEQNAAAINEQAMVDGMAKEAVNDIKGLPNCDLTELL